MKKLIRGCMLLGLLVCLLVGCQKGDDKSTVEHDLSNEKQQKETGVEVTGKASNETDSSDKSQTETQEEAGEETHTEVNQPVVPSEMDPKAMFGDTDTAKVNRVMSIINTHHYRDTNRSTKDYEEAEVQGYPETLLSEMVLEEKNLVTEYVACSALDHYNNILLPRVVGEQVYFWVKDNQTEGIYYLLKWNDKEEIDLLYTYAQPESGEDFVPGMVYNIEIKVSPSYIIYKIFDDVILYDHVAHEVARHMRYEDVFGASFDISHDGKRIVYNDTKQNLIMSELDLSQGQMIIKAYSNPKDELSGSQGKYPQFIDGSYKVMVMLIGYEWSYGNALYDPETDTFTKVVDKGVNGRSISDSLIALEEGYGECGLLGIIDWVHESYIHNDTFCERVGEYGIEWASLGTPLRNQQKDVYFLDLNMGRRIMVQDLHTFECISPDGDYLIQKDYEGQYQLYRIEVK